MENMKNIDNKTCDLSRRLISLIHVAKNKLKLTDEDYRLILFSATKKESTKNMNESELKEVVCALEKLGFTSKNKIVINKNECGALSIKQVKYIKSLWQKVAREKTETALNNFILRTAGKNSLTLLTQKEAHNLITALVKMQNSNNDS